MKVATIEPTFDSWRTYARSLLSEKVHYDDIVWKTSGTGSLFDLMSADHRPSPAQLSIPQSFMQDAAFVSAFRDDTTWALLYRLAFRLIYENKHLMSVALDTDVLEFHRRMRLVSRDLHKVKAFVRFKEIKKNDESIYMAWHRPDHRVLKFSAPFFTDRFNGMNWVIFTEDESMSWINNQLTFGPGITQQEALAFDHTEELWKTYYGSIFNPARIKVKAMKKELPVRHWATLPEASIIDDLLRQAPKRLEEFYESQRASAVSLIQENVSSLSELKAAIINCAACSICSKATAPVFGEGPMDAEIVFVGEQPGNEEDMAGSPFVGPAGKLFMDALDKADIKRSDVYLTNAVKGFKWKEHNGMRKHVNPSSFEISACRAWVKSELELIKPRILVCLGASAAQSVFGKLMKVHDSHGKIFKTAFCDQTIILPHPSAILRTQDPEEKMHLETRFLGDIMALKNI
ncbi:uracil-DNA glycosylase [Bacteriovorax stolpii]|uniref:Type-4 uracil-DNA glycosylase n=1 Tax=Bacteriovorax stolpii TaxID=960 RepID=A0A2K9NQJ2_BACTC|nr:uracil-DNA glycosylase [Bacteriovorax stolpii]TDP51594.1 DNA polymerase [Bacteriovorax stolpii]